MTRSGARAMAAGMAGLALPLFLALAGSPAPLLLAQGTKERAHSIEGVVRLAPLLAPAENVWVKLERRGQVLGQTVTDSNGGFVFSRVPPGEYIVRASLDGYRADPVSVSIKNGSVLGLILDLARVASTGPPAEATVSAQELGLSPEARRAYEKGLAELGQARYQPALAYFRKIIELHPNFAGAHYGLGVGQYFGKEYEQAERALRRAIVLDPRFDSAYVLLGRLLNDRQRYGEAQTVLRQAVHQRPDRWDSFYELGRSFAAQGNFEAAAGKLQQAHGLEGVGFEVHILLANVLLVRGEHEAALGEMRHYLDTDPKGPFAEEVRVKARLLRQELEKAEASGN